MTIIKFKQFGKRKEKKNSLTIKLVKLNRKKYIIVQRL